MSRDEARRQKYGKEFYDYTMHMLEDHQQSVNEAGTNLMQTVHSLIAESPQDKSIILDGLRICEESLKWPE